MRQVEIHGIKVEFDERTATSIEQYRVGDRVKVLVKQYSDNYTVYPGVIVGFSNFKELPTIEIMYLTNVSTEPFKFAVLNEKTTDIDLAPFNELEFMLDKESIIQGMDSAIVKAEREIIDLKVKREYFITRFSKAFEIEITEHEDN